MPRREVGSKDLNAQVRKLNPVELHKLARILDISDQWKKLMAIVPKQGKKNSYLFNSNHIVIIENAAQLENRTCAEIFLDEWSTIGRNPLTISKLLKLLIKAELFRAADYVSIEILHKNTPERPNSGPAAEIDVSDEGIAKWLKEKDKNPESVSSEGICTNDIPNILSLTSDDFDRQNIDAYNKNLIKNIKEMDEFNETDYIEERREMDNAPTKNITDGLSEMSVKEDEINLIEFSQDHSNLLAGNIEKSINFPLQMASSEIPVFINSTTFNSSNFQSKDEFVSISLSQETSDGSTESSNKNDSFEMPIGTLEISNDSSKKSTFQEKSDSATIPIMVLEMDSSGWNSSKN